MMMMASGNNNKINNVKSDVFLVNFDEEELMHLQDLLKEMKEEYGLERDVNAVIVNESNWFLTVDGAETNEATSTTTTVKPPYPESCRVRVTERRQRETLNAGVERSND